MFFSETRKLYSSNYPYYKTKAFGRCFFSSSKSKVDIKLITELRELTKLPLSICKQALEQNQNSLDKSLEWLRLYALSSYEQSHEKSKTQIEKDASLIGLWIPHDKKSANIVIGNCETGFGANSESFKSFLLNVCQRLSASTLNQDMNIKFQEELSDIRAKLRERVELRYHLALSYSNDESNLYFGYCHPPLTLLNISSTAGSFFLGQHLGLIGVHAPKTIEWNESIKLGIRRMCQQLATESMDEIKDLGNIDSFIQRTYLWNPDLTLKDYLSSLNPGLGFTRILRMDDLQSLSPPLMMHLNQ